MIHADFTVLGMVRRGCASLWDIPFECLKSWVTPFLQLVFLTFYLDTCLPIAIQAESLQDFRIINDWIAGFVN